MEQRFSLGAIIFGKVKKKWPRDPDDNSETTKCHWWITLWRQVELMLWLKWPCSSHTDSQMVLCQGHVQVWGQLATLLGDDLWLHSRMVINRPFWLLADVLGLHHLVYGSPECPAWSSCVLSTHYFPHQLQRPSLHHQEPLLTRLSETTHVWGILDPLLTGGHYWFLWCIPCSHGSHEFRDQIFTISLPWVSFSLNQRRVNKYLKL
jgi:hypothetical protein